MTPEQEIEQLRQAIQHADELMRAAEGVGLLYFIRDISDRPDLVTLIEKVLSEQG